MTDLRKVLAITSILFLIVLAITPFKDFFREWRWYQYAYNRFIPDLPQRVKPADIGIKQIWVQQFGRVDRCVTCHLGLKEPALANAKQPFRTHPAIYHDIEDFGCTICHEGQGAATDYEESIGKVKHWDKPAFSKEFMEAACGKCHKEREVPQAPVLNLGRKLIEESNCIACHKIEGYEKQWVPRLDGIGSKVNRTWLVQWLKHPKQYFAKTRMPNFRFSDEDANTLADFLLAFKSPAGNSPLLPLPALLASKLPDGQKAKLIELGSTRFSEARCISCHAINGKGGYVATDLGKVASKANAQWLYNYIKDPKKYSPDVLMPHYRFSEKELIGIVAYIQSEFVDYEIEQLPPHTPEPAFYEKGLALFKKSNCGGCHALRGISKVEELGPELTYVGDKKPYEIDYGKTTIEQTLPIYITTKLLDPKVFSSTSQMPNYEFNDKEARAIATALLGNTNETIPINYIIHPKPKNTFTPQGEFGKLVKDLACMGCHVMNGSGRLVATDLSIEASQAQSKWIAGYFKIPYSLRPTLTERMPNLFIPEGEVKTIVDYMQKVFIEDSLSHEFPANPTLSMTGHGLFYDKYGCQSCHQIGGKGGYVGPPLDKIGTRLTPGWIFHWLKNPQAFKPESIEPNNVLTDHEAEALTAFLMTLK